MRSIDRRTFLRGGLGLAAATTLTACSANRSAVAPVAYVSPGGAEVRAAEASRRPGSIREFRLTADVGEIDLGGTKVTTWTYGEAVPGPQIRVTTGEVVRARLTNGLPADTSVHWHGLALRNDADGVPGVTQEHIAPGAEYAYEFTAAHPGTYWFHPHSGTQLDRGLYAPLIVEDPREPLGYDAEWVVVLDDWLDGVTGTPDDVLAELRSGMGHGSGMHGGPESASPGGGSGADDPMGEMDHSMHGGMAAPSPTPSPGTTGGHMLMGATSPLLGGDAGDVRYPHFLLNGRVPAAPEVFRAKPGTRLRIRLINAAADTAFRVALGGHRVTVTHTDGFATEPVEADALLVGMGERYDVLVTLKDGVFPLVALAEGKNAVARGLIRTGKAATPPADLRTKELDGEIARYDLLRPAEAVRLPQRAPDRTIRLELTGGMMAYDWGFNGAKYDPKTIHPVASGDRVRLVFVNRTTMWHPVHLHGHTFALASTGLRKDTAIVLPQQTLEVDFQADNPGLWMIHCHNIYHAEAGMMTTLGYRT